MTTPSKAHKLLDYNATLLKRIDLTEKLAIFLIQPDLNPVPVEEPRFSIPDFAAGQYAVLGANNRNHPEKGSVRRAYSIASPPEEKRWLEFYIRYVEHPESDNPLTPLLWDMKAGDRLWLGKKIVGHFTMERTVGMEDKRLKLFVAAGTGLAPFVSIIRSCLQKNEERTDPLSRFVVLHGASHPHELGYKEDLEQVLNDIRNRYFPTISRPQQSPGWKGDTGRVETFFDSEKLSDLENRLGLEPGCLNPEQAVIYICGLQGTIANTLINLLKRGFVPDDRQIRSALRLPQDLPSSLFFEQYDSEPIIDFKNQEFMDRLRATFPQGILIQS